LTLRCIHRSPFRSLHPPRLGFHPLSRPSIFGIPAKSLVNEGLFPILSLFLLYSRSVAEPRAAIFPRVICLRHFFRPNTDRARGNSDHNWGERERGTAAWRAAAKRVKTLNIVLQFSVTYLLKKTSKKPPNYVCSFCSELKHSHCKMFPLI
jgi:hypothetical protein